MGVVTGWPPSRSKILFKTRNSIAFRLIAAVLAVELLSSLAVIFLSLGYERHTHFMAFDIMLRGHAVADGAAPGKAGVRGVWEGWGVWDGRATRAGEGGSVANTAAEGRAWRRRWLAGCPCWPAAQAGRPWMHPASPPAHQPGGRPVQQLAGLATASGASSQRGKQPAGQAPSARLPQRAHLYTVHS